MRKKSIFCLFLAVLLLFCCGCSPLSAPKEDGPTDPSLEEMRDSRYVYLTLWSWQISSEDEAAAYAQKAKECGFTAVDFGVLWSDFEPLKGRFDWSYLDGVVQSFADAGLKVSLQPLLWTKDLSWAGDLALQKTENGKVYAMEERGSFVSFTDEKTLSVVENTLQNFALHASSAYGEHLTRWGVRLSGFGEFDYTVNAELDYSESSLREFYDYLKETYGSWQDFSEKTGLLVASRKDLESLDAQSVVSACRGDWRRFRQQRLFDLLERTVHIYRSADATVPIVFSLGTYGNGMNTAYSGVVDLWSALEGYDVDIVAFSLCDGADAGMALSLFSSLTTKKLSVEVDGAWALEEGRDVASQVTLCGKSEVFSLATANFTLQQLEVHRETLASYAERFFTEERFSDRDPTRGILICSNEISEAQPPESFDALYGDAWNILSEKGARRVRFVTEEQIACGEISLEGVTRLYLGDINGFVSVSKEFAEAIAATEVTLVGDVSFRFLDGTKPDGDLKAALENRMKSE